MSAGRHSVVRTIKDASNIVALVAIFPMALTCWAEERLRPGAESVFGFWTHIMALLPGMPGLYLRRAFYNQTLRQCSLTAWIDYGVLFAHRTAHVEDEAYVGAYSVIGSARLRRGCLIGTRANLLSGSAQHEMQPDGRWGSSDPTRFQEIDIGENVWIGEGAIVMANVGPGTMVSAGAVVSSAVPAGIVVAGNPARYVRNSGGTGLAVADPASGDHPIAAPYLGFIDWLKCLGILVIAYGHLAGWAPLAMLPPIYSKQIGVAFFLFVTGYSLSRDPRGRWQVAFNRLFEVYLLGLGVALIVSLLAYVTQRKLQLSNYSPFVGGANVLFNNFPANPTTWYFGTYLHLILLWALVAHRIRVSLPVIALSLVAEIAIRAWLAQAAGGYIAYMALPNWSTVFLLGCWYGQRRDWKQAAPHRIALASGVVLAASVIAWSLVAAKLPFEQEFPFMHLTGYPAATGMLLVSALVSTVYLATTWLTFLTVFPLRAPEPVRFIARNTLLIVFGHMPILFVLQPLLQSWGASHLVMSVVLIAICVPGLGWVSEIIHRGGRPRALRDWVYNSLHARVRTPSRSTT